VTALLPVDSRGGAQPDAASLLEIRGLSHRFGDRVVLDELSLAVAAGEVVGLLGPNGSGKSTTFRVLTGLLVPDRGQVLLRGEPVEPGGRALRQHMGVVFQSPSLDARLTVLENLRMSAALYGITGATAARRIQEHLELAGLADRTRDRVLELSGGMKRRIELCRALLHEPSLLVMDEPTTGLDETSFRQTWARLAQLKAARGLTVLLSTHRADEAEHCDRVIVIDGGKVIAQGTPDDLRRRVSGDVLSLVAHDPEALCEDIRRLFSIEARVLEGRVVLEHERGHELIPRLVEALPKGRLDALSMHRPTLADVFVKLTGRALGMDAPNLDTKTKKKA
jgi:ABC-2 type transport system ATP-binding protein